MSLISERPLVFSEHGYLRYKVTPPAGYLIAQGGFSHVPLRFSFTVVGEPTAIPPKVSISSVLVNSILVDGWVPARLNSNLDPALVAQTQLDLVRTRYTYSGMLVEVPVVKPYHYRAIEFMVEVSFAGGAVQKLTSLPVSSPDHLIIREAICIPSKEVEPISFWSLESIIYTGITLMGLASLIYVSVATGSQPVVV